MGGWEIRIIGVYTYMHMEIGYREGNFTLEFPS